MRRYRIEEPGAERYFKEWLCDFVGGYGDYYYLLRLLFEKDFYSVIDNDDNRAAYGLLLRSRYCRETGNELGELGPCSVLEMLIALAISIDVDFMMEKDRSNRFDKWFWMMIDNLGLLNGFHDDVFMVRQNRAEIIIDRWLSREYEFDGTGGLFPLRDPKTDQRNVEIWYQMQAFLIERTNFDV